jgi:dipeptidyl-peptidase 4
MSPPGQLVRTQRCAAGVPGQFTVTLDGTAVVFLRSRAGDDPVTCLWALDLATGTERLLADPADLLNAPRREGTGIGAYVTDSAGALAAFALAGGVVDGRCRRRPRPAAAGPGTGD